MSDNNHIPENSATNSPPDNLQETAYSCGHDGCDATFETAQALAEHTVNCDRGQTAPDGTTEGE